MDFTTNYCGPYWSDGKFQPSVAEGESSPVSDVDAACQIHDRDYALAEGAVDMLRQADTDFWNATRSLGAKGRLYGGAVSYFNQLARGPNFDVKGPLEKKQLDWLHSGDDDRIVYDPEPRALELRRDLRKNRSDQRSNPRFTTPPITSNHKDYKVEPPAGALPAYYRRRLASRAMNHRKQFSRGKYGISK